MKAKYFLVSLFVYVAYHAHAEVGTYQTRLSQSQWHSVSDSHSDSVSRGQCQWRTMALAASVVAQPQAQTTSTDTGYEKDMAQTTTLTVPVTCVMVCSVPSGQLVFSSRPVVKTVRYFRPLVGTSGQLGEYFVRQFMRPSPSWRGEMYQKRFFNLLTRGQCMFMHCYFVSGPTEN